MANTVELDFTVDGGGSVPTYSFDVTLTLSATANAQGYYTVIGATGSGTIGSTTVNITGVSNGTDGADNLFNPSGVISGATPSDSIVTGNGITFTTDDSSADAAGATTGAAASDIDFYLGGSDEYGIDTSAIGGPTFISGSQGSVSVTNISLCFCSGTRLKTSHGDVAVEDLAVGDLVVTTSGQTRPIMWIGQKRVEAPAREAWPVRVMADAFGPGLPTRDLFLSPGHAVCVKVMDEVFVPIADLMNGATVAQVEVAEVTYWHVELESHDVLLAEGLGCESYMDAGNRAFFGHEYGRLDAIDPERVAESLSRYARPFVDKGPVVEAVRQRLVVRAEALGWVRTQDIDLHLIVDGARVEPEVDGDLARFIFPATAQTAALVSKTFTPANLGHGDDWRPLGVRLDGLLISDGLRLRCDVPLERLEGVYPCEADAGQTWRWSDGRLGIPAELWAEAKGEVILRLQHSPEAVWTWVAPSVGAAIADAA